jgi:hypothetical protein
MAFLQVSAAEQEKPLARMRERTAAGYLTCYQQADSHK